MKIYLIPLFLIVFSCSQHGVPPRIPIDELLKKDSLSDEGRQAVLISTLSNENFSGCSELANLINTQKHVLTPWLISKFIEKCNVEQSYIEKIYSGYSTLPSWSHEYILNSIYLKTTDPQIKVSVILTSIQFEKTQKDKITKLEEALKTSKDHNFESSLIVTELEKVAPRFISKVTDENIFSIARDYEKNRDFTKARSLYRKIINSKKSTLTQVIDAWERIRMSYKLDGEKDSYLAQTSKLVNYLSLRRKDPLALDKYVEYSITLARIYWTADNFPSALVRLNQLLTNTKLEPKHKAQIYFYLGGINEDRNRFDDAISFYKQSFEMASNSGDYNFGDLKYDSLWNIVWYLYKNKNHQESYDWIQKYNETKSVDNKFIFWKAALEKKLGLEDKFIQTIETLRKNDPYGYYGQLSYIYGGSLQSLPRNLEKIKFKNDPLSWALYCKEDKLAQSILDSDPNTKLSKYYEASYYHKMIFKFFALNDAKKEELISNSPLYSFPLAFSDEFQSEIRSHIVSAPLMMSIARQESAFNPLARSPADAFGLLQIIPTQGERLAKIGEIEYKDYNDLYDVKKNIALSSILLEELMKRQNGNFINFVASYNAGENPVHRWRKRNTELSDIEFIEQIPYRETRNYVKLVSRNYWIYKRLLSNENILINNSFFSEGKY